MCGRDSSRCSSRLHEATYSGIIHRDRGSRGDSPRGAEDIRPQGSCASVSYPVPAQIGQNYNGTAYFTDPIYIWGNTGAQEMNADWGWGNPCGLTFSDFWQEGRDYVLGTAKPSYTAYTYPHPLVDAVETPSASSTSTIGGKVSIGGSGRIQ